MILLLQWSCGEPSRAVPGRFGANDFFKCRNIFCSSWKWRHDLRQNDVWLTRHLQNSLLHWNQFSWAEDIVKKGLIPASFLFVFVFSRYNFNTNWKKPRWCAWDANLGLQDGRRRWNHGAMAQKTLFESDMLTRIICCGVMEPWSAKPVVWDSAVELMAHPFMPTSWICSLAWVKVGIVVVLNMFSDALESKSQTWGAKEDVAEFWAWFTKFSV